jgi:hypothetical protein
MSRFGSIIPAFHAKSAAKLPDFSDSQGEDN